LRVTGRREPGSASLHSDGAELMGDDVAVGAGDLAEKEGRAEQRAGDGRRVVAAARLQGYKRSGHGTDCQQPGDLP
jgi:hypothetical protein